ncbi:MAG: chemotaxis protein CheB, partial [Natronospirillum sp.]
RSARGTPPALAVLADQLVQQQRLRELLAVSGYRVVICTSPHNLAHHLRHAADIDLWLVDGDLEVCPKPQRDWLLDNSSTRILFDEGPNCPRDDPGYEIWARRLLASIKKHLSIGLNGAPGLAPMVETVRVLPPTQDTSRYQAPQEPPLPMPAELSAYVAATHSAEIIPELWILAASLGGPQAVKQFLDALPANLPCTFIYAQHIDAEFEAQLARTIGRHSALTLQCLQHNDRLLTGHVYIAPIKHLIQFDQRGQVQMLDQPWQGPYSPSLDELMLIASEHYPSRTHCMVFSGMGGDALTGSAAIRQHGGEVWTQSADSCIQSDMPRVIEEEGLATGGGDPRTMALQLIGYLTARLTNSIPSAAG